MVGALLRERRERADLTQHELGQALDPPVSDRTIRAWENGKMPRPKHRRALRAFFEALDEGVAA